MNVEFEKQFDNFLESNIYDQAEESIFMLVRAAFIEGYKAAGGKDAPELSTNKVVYINPRP